MKKLLVILMVVAIASFLFVGCLPGVTPEPEPEPEPTEPTVAATVAPIITSITDNAAVPAVVISLTSTATQYMNKTEVALGIIVNGTAPTYSEVKVYIDDICAGTADVGVSGTFSVVVAKADLGVDGEKTLYATAKEAALAVSAKSVEYAYTLDTVAPSIKSSSAKAGTAAVYQFVETTDSIALVPDSNIGSATGPPFTEALIETQVLAINLGAEYFSIPALALAAAVWTGEQIIAPFASVPLTNSLMAGVITWKIEVIQAVTGGDTTIRVYNLTAGTFLDYTYLNLQAGVSTSWIPGLIVTVPALLTGTDVGGYCLITTTNTAATSGYIDVTFGEAVTGTSILAVTTTWTAFAATVNLAPTVTVRSATVARLTEAVAGTMAVGQAYSVSVSGIIDLAGNPILATAPSTSTGIVLP